MTTADTADRASPLPPYRKALCVVYGTLALAALIGTVSQIAPYLQNPGPFFLMLLRAAEVNPSVRFVIADLLLLALTATILMVMEARRHKVRFVWAYVVIALLIAISVAFPLFLIARELRIAASAESRPPVTDTILLTLLATAVGGLTIWVLVAG